MLHTDLFHVVGIISDNDDYHPVLRFDTLENREHLVSIINFEYIKDEIQNHIIEDIFALEVECQINFLRVRVIPSLVQFTISYIKIYKFRHHNADIGWYLWSLGF